MVSSSVVLTAGAITAICYVVYLIVGLLQGIRKQRAALKQWPGLPTHWLYGNIHQHPMFDAKVRSQGGEEGFRFHRELTARYPRGFYFFLGPTRGILTANHPDIMRPIMKSGDPKPLEQGQPSYHFAVPWLGEGLLIAKGDKWFRNRRLLTPAFHFDVLKPYMGVFNEAVDILLDKMDSYAESGESFEVSKNVSACTLDILLRCAFTQEMNCQTSGDHPYVQAVGELTGDIIERCFNFLYYFDVFFNLSSLGKKFHKNCDLVHRFADNVIAGRRVELEKGQAAQADSSSRRKYLDFLDILLSARDEDGKGLTDLEIRNEVDTFLFEGHDTTASSLTWILYFLALYPEHQARVQEEIDEVLSGRDSDNIGWDDLGKFPYLVQCLKESLRIYPPVPFIQRVIQNDVEIDGKILPAGTTLDVSVYNLHHNPEIWPDHMEYIPDRFSPENIQKIDPFAYLPFAAGPRNCIGQNFAMNEEKVLLARLLRRFHIELDPDHPVVLSNHLILKAHHDIKIKITKRKL
ncbi:cytochrome P450 4F4-like isoform X2 [Patiria miniata]|uniref:Cytochrome P450 n=1 Tax=Patiria miniata TaxID=46514 RepID=A0A914ATB9_PATMI|nr:cytochrome P450 4F4-like isoform X2 [Patiria miniata]